MNSLKKFALDGSVSLSVDLGFIFVITIFLILRYATETIAGIPVVDYLLVLAILATLPVFVSAIKALRNKKISVDLLASLALLFSFLGHEWTSAAFITLMLASARILDTWSDSRAESAIESLFKLRPKSAKVKRGELIAEVPIISVVVGDIVVVSLGEMIPVDGIVISGSGSINQASLTGESLPKEVGVGDRVMSSSIVVEGSFIFKAEAVGADTTLEKVIHLVEEAQKNKAPITTIADRFASWYIGGALIVSLLIYLLTHNLSLVLSVLLVVCADDIAVAIPLAFLMAILRAAKRGVVLKGASYLEALKDTKAIIVDKTGTLTFGQLNVDHFKTTNSINEEDLLRAGEIASSNSRHPVAVAVRRFIDGKVPQLVPEGFNEIAGKGAIAAYENNSYIFGRLSFFEERGVAIHPEIRVDIEKDIENGFNVTLIGRNTSLLGYFAIADQMKPNIKESIEKLRALGTERIVMLTGDNEAVGARVANEVGIKEYKTNLLPEGKVKEVENIIKEENGKGVVMVGDGVNDAAALKLANVGIVMGAGGSDVAIEAADVVLMHDDFSKIPYTLELSKKVMDIAKGNFIIWVIMNSIGLFLVFNGTLHPTGAAAFNFLTDFIPIFNSMRVLRL